MTSVRRLFDVIHCWRRLDVQKLVNSSGKSTYTMPSTIFIALTSLWAEDVFISVDVFMTSCWRVIFFLMSRVHIWSNITWSWLFSGTIFREWRQKTSLWRLCRYYDVFMTSLCRHDGESFAFIIIFLKRVRPTVVAEWRLLDVISNRIQSVMYFQLNFYVENLVQSSQKIAMPDNASHTYIWLTSLWRLHDVTISLGLPLF